MAVKGKGMTQGQAGASALGMIPPQVYLYVIGIPVVIGFAYFGIVRPILKKTGVIDTPESKEMDKINDSLWSGRYWSPLWYKNNGGKSITEQQAVSYANIIKDAVDGWGTDEEAIYGVFEQLGSKGNVSKVAESYSRIQGGESLSERLKSELDDEEQLTLASKITNYQ